MSVLAKEARREQARGEVTRLREELQTWFEDWTAADTHADGSPRGQYKTQLTSIYAEVKATIQILCTNIGELDVSGDAGEVYAQCALIERQTIWLRRVWYFFRDKFEQRRDPRFNAVLQAADEVVWSCYRPFFQPPNRPQPLQPAPLPYIELDFSPSSLRRDQKEALGRRDADFVLVKTAFAELPIPILRLPITSLANPWALVLIGHEIGHIVEPVVANDFRATFQSAVRSAVYATCQKAEDAEAWSGWADEIFADLYSILTMGQWAIWAMTQFETADKSVMEQRRYVYPSPIVRLALMTAFARYYGLEQDAFAVADSADEVRRDLDYIESVVAATVGLKEIETIVNALPFSAVAYQSRKIAGAAGEVEQWALHLGGKGAAPATNKLQSARMLAAAGAMAWSTSVFTEEERPADRGQALCESVLARIKASAAPGTRSVAASPRAGREPGRALFDVVRRADALLEQQDRANPS